MRHPAPLPSLDELVELTRAHGIEHFGVAPAGVLERARHELHARRDAGLHGGMGFTYRNPDRSTDPQRVVAGAQSLLVAARSYLVDEPARPTGVQARVAKYAWVDHYRPLRAALRAVARRLKASGERAVVCCDDNNLVDREAAYSAGLGWFGKNANLLLPGAGSWFVLGSVVTTAAFAPNTEAVGDGCGSCRRCLDACPTGAIVAPGVIDANRCLAWVLQKPGSIQVELRPAVGDRIYGCDDCQDSCPPSVRFSGRHRGDAAMAAGASDGIGDGLTAGSGGAKLQAWVDVLDLLDASDEALIARHGRWYIADRDPRWLRRNALVVLGNTAEASSVRTLATIARYEASDDELLAEHARWARRQLSTDRKPNPSRGALATAATLAARVTA